MNLEVYVRASILNIIEQYFELEGVFQTIFREIISVQINHKITVLRIWQKRICCKEQEYAILNAYFLLKIRYLFRVESCILYEFIIHRPSRFW